MTPKILVLISGNGSNLQALINAKEQGQLKAEISLVISSSSKAFGIERAKKHNIPVRVHELKTYYQGIPKEEKAKRAEKRNEFDQDLVKIILSEKPDLVVCAGWMLILGEKFLQPLQEKNISIINLHPSLPGAFEGINAIERSYNAGQNGEITKGGIMIHRVILEVDRGQPLIVREIDVIKGETLESWEARIHSLEHQAIVDGTNKALDELK
ncbi:BA75_05141T0 [Komagataella pastoris]|uniref:Phosphoribosylglycinamide formyltransferase n=1 Tax=Komagataella pastoris TaxID=4922 RepID=A0A1B2JI76_PICPA|nr:BA75_05141T0 [Komagataella pastoris]